LFRTGLQLQSANKGDSDIFWELDLELSRELDLRPWHPSIFDITADLDDEDIAPEHRLEYAHVIAFRRALVGALHPR
jgi:hypothetical protein